MRQTIIKLLSSDIDTKTIENITQIDSAIIDEYRNHIDKVGELSLDQAEKLFDLQDDIDFLDAQKPLDTQGFKDLVEEGIEYIDSIDRFYSHVLEDNYQELFVLTLKQYMDQNDFLVYVIEENNVLKMAIKDALNIQQIKPIIDASPRSTMLNSQYYIFESQADAERFIKLKHGEQLETFLARKEIE